jgi:hypothetical protein
MKRQLIRLGVTLLTFTIGVALAIWGMAYNARLKAEQPAKQDNAQQLIPPVIHFSVPPRGLAAELESIDKKYKQRCSIPDWIEDTVPQAEEAFQAGKELHKLDACSDEWAKARREAIQAKREHFMVTY